MKTIKQHMAHCEAWCAPYPEVVKAGVQYPSEYHEWRPCMMPISETRDGHRVCSRHAKSKYVEFEPYKLRKHHA